MAAPVDLRQRADHVRFVAEIHRAVGIFPLAEHAEALEIGALQIDLLGRVFAAQPAEFGSIDLDPYLADAFFDRDLDRQAMAIPARHIRRTESGK